jgi:hypothetical protein
VEDLRKEIMKGTTKKVDNSAKWAPLPENDLKRHKESISVLTDAIKKY